MIDASSHNLSLEADQLVTSKFIQRVLSLHLPFFEVALLHLWFSVRDRVFISPSTTVCKDHAREKNVSVCPTSVCLPVWCVRSKPYFCVFARGWEKAGEEGANLYKLWRIQGHPFMCCQPAVKHFPIKAVLNSAVIPIPASQFGSTTLGVFEHHPFSSL